MIRKTIVFLITVTVLLFSSKVFSATINVHYTPNTNTPSTAHGTTVSGNLWINVVAQKLSGWTMQSINVTSATYQELAHGATPKAISFSHTASCSLCGDPNQIIAASTDPSLIFSFTHNAVYTIRVIGNIVRSRPAPPPVMIETQTTPFDVSKNVTFNSINITQAPDYIVAWDPATMTNVNMSCTTNDAQTGLASYKYTIGGTEYTFNDQPRPGTHNFTWTPGSTLPKGLYSTKMNVYSNIPHVAGDSNRSSYLTINNASVKYNGKDSSGNHKYLYNYTLKDSKNNNATSGVIWVYNTNLTKIGTYSITGLQANSTGVNHQAEISISESLMQSNGNYYFVLHCVDGNQNEYKNHTNKPAIESIIPWQAVIADNYDTSENGISGTADISAYQQRSTTWGNPYISFSHTDDTPQNLIQRVLLRSNILMIYAHGGPGYVKIGNGSTYEEFLYASNAPTTGCLAIDTFSFHGVRFAGFISCHSGITDANGGGNLVDSAYNSGALCSLGFLTTLTAYRKYKTPDIEVYYSHLYNQFFWEAAMGRLDLDANGQYDSPMTAISAHNYACSQMESIIGGTTTGYDNDYWKGNSGITLAPATLR